MKTVFPLFVDILQAALVAPDPLRALSDDHVDAQLEIRTKFPTSAKIRGIVMPFFGPEQRGMNVGSAPAGGYLVGGSVENIGLSLRSNLVLERLGASVMIGLRNDLTLPYGLGELSCEWASESTQAQVKREGLGRLFMTPKRITATVRISRQLVAQGAAAEAVIRQEISAAIAAEIERVAIAGRTATGSMLEPLGILGVAGVHEVEGGTNGAEPTWEHLTELEYLVGNANADRGHTGWLASPLVRRKLRRTLRSGAGSQLIWHGPPNELIGHPAGVTTNVPDTLSKGTSSENSSAIIHAEFSELFVGIWGPGLDILVNPYTEAETGNVLVHVNAFVDTGVRNPAAFAVMRDALCAS